MVFSNILVPIDGSDHSYRAVEYASKIALKFDANLILLHIYTFIPPISTSNILSGSVSYDVLSPETIVVLSKKAEKDANQILIQAKRRVQTTKINVKSLLVEGRIISEILRVINTENIDLIVMGARGITGIKKMVLGSTSEAIVHKASIPVLIVK